MYKKKSQNLQRSNRVVEMAKRDTVYISDDDLNADVASMTLEEARAERLATLPLKTQAENELRAAKKAGAEKACRGLGYRIQAHCNRLSAISTRIKALQGASKNKSQRALMEVVSAVRDYLPPDGIDEKEAMSRIIGAIDNPEINPVIAAMERDLAAEQPKATLDKGDLPEGGEG